EGVGRIVRLHQAPQRHHDALDVGLGLDAERSFCEGGTHDLRAVCKPQRLQCRIETASDILVGIRIDDANAQRRIAHGCSQISCRLRSTRCPVALQAVIDEYDAVMTDPDVKSAKSSLAVARLARRSRGLQSPERISRAKRVRAMAVVEYRSRRSATRLS